MAEFVFTSPGYKFRERDLSFVVRNVGITTLGAVGETEKGPAFETVFIEDKGQFRTRKTGAATFTGIRYDFTANTVVNGSGTVDQIAYTVTGASYADYEDMVLAVIRSRGDVTDNDDAAPTTRFDTDTLTMISNETNSGIGDIFGSFELQAFKAGDSVDPDPSTETFVVSLDPNATEYLPNVIGDQPKNKNSKIWCEAVYGDLIKKLDADGIAYGVNTVLIDADSDAFTNYREQFQTPETPWVVSELKGNDVDRLFKFISISDGDAANKEIKISITDIDTISKEFNVVVRDFNDSDSDISVI